MRVKIYYAPTRIRLDIQAFSHLGSSYVAWFDTSKERAYTVGIQSILNYKNVRNGHRHSIFYKVCLYPLAYIKTDFLIKNKLIPFAEGYNETTIYVLESKPIEYVFPETS